MTRKEVHYEGEKETRIVKVYVFGILVYKKTHELYINEKAALRGY